MRSRAKVLDAVTDCVAEPSHLPRELLHGVGELLNTLLRAPLGLGEALDGGFEAVHAFLSALLRLRELA